MRPACADSGASSWAATRPPEAPDAALAHGIAGAIVAAQAARQLDRDAGQAQRLDQRARHAPVARRDRVVGRLQRRVEGDRPAHAAIRSACSSTPPRRAASRSRPRLHGELLEHARAARRGRSAGAPPDRAISAASACGQRRRVVRRHQPPVDAVLDQLGHGRRPGSRRPAAPWRPPPAARSAGRRDRRPARSGSPARTDRRAR